MRITLRGIAALALVAFSSVPVFAQTADEVIEKYLAAIGGRAALAKATSRVSTGKVSISTPAGELTGTLEVSNKVPNKSRTLIKLDLSALGAGEMTSDQRFDGTTGYQIDTFQGNRDITGDQLEALKNGVFPTPLLDYKANGLTVALAEKEKVGDKDAHVLVVTPKTGRPWRMFFDAESFMLVKQVLTINVPQVGGDLEQTIEFSDFRDVDGYKLAFTVKSANQVQKLTATLTDVKHNTPIDDSSFARPPGQ
jgi:outer membrane lipoprotein-sorting protein